MNGAGDQAKQFGGGLLKEIKQFKGRAQISKDKIGEDIAAFKALHKKIGEKEKELHQVQVQQEQLAVYTPQLEAVTKRLHTYVQLTRELDDRGLSTAEQAALANLKVFHESASGAFTDINHFSSLVSWQVFLQEQLETLKEHKLTAAKFLCKAYELQQDALPAWKKLKEMKFESLSAYKTQNSDLKTVDLLKLSITLGL